jgi:hypothetical protein
MPFDEAKEPESGKSTTPCERMHVAYSTRLPPVPCATPVVVVAPRLFTPGVDEPHAASVTPAERIAAVNCAARRVRGRHLG